MSAWGGTFVLKICGPRFFFNKIDLEKNYNQEIFYNEEFLYEEQDWRGTVYKYRDSANDIYIESYPRLTCRFDDYDTFSDVKVRIKGKLIFSEDKY